MISMPLVAVALSLLLSQLQIPQGVRYHTTTDEINHSAEVLLTKLFSSPVETADFKNISDKIVMCGPGLWPSINSAVTASGVPTKRLQLIIPTASGNQQAEGRAFQEPQAKETLWMCVLGIADDYHAGTPSKPPKFVVRKLRSDEISYFWSMIPFDIQEPIYIVDMDKRRFLVNLSAEREPKINWIDLLH
jgi:hypothetical protein